MRARVGCVGLLRCGARSCLLGGGCPLTLVGPGWCCKILSQDDDDDDDDDNEDGIRDKDDDDNDVVYDDEAAVDAAVLLAISPGRPGECAGGFLGLGTRRNP